MLKRSLGLYPTPCGMHCHCSTSLCSNLGNVAAGKGYDHAPTSLDYPRDGRREMDRGPEGQSRGKTFPACKQFLAILHVCWHCLARSEKCFKQSDRFAEPVGESLNPHSIGL